jgi:hypothetical protein
LVDRRSRALTMTDDDRQLQHVSILAGVGP